LKGLSLEVPDGQIVALLGVNGAGKTSTLNAISGLLKTGDGKVTDGSIEFMGQRVDGRDPEDIRRLGIALHDCPTHRLQSVQRGLKLTGLAMYVTWFWLHSCADVPA
jgi:ABC-type branched-subunit amino acid transport system ATPase component